MQVQVHAFAEHALQLQVQRHLAWRHRQVAGRRQVQEAGGDQHALHRQRAGAGLHHRQFLRQLADFGVGAVHVRANLGHLLFRQVAALEQQLLPGLAPARGQRFQFTPRAVQQHADAVAVIDRSEAAAAGFQCARELALELQDLRDEHGPGPHRHAPLPVAARLGVHAFTPAAPGVDDPRAAALTHQQADDDLVAAIQCRAAAPHVTGQARGRDLARGLAGFQREVG